MKLILFGGAEVALGQVGPECKLIEEAICRLAPRQVLHVPFARIKASEPEWSGDWFHRYISLGDIEYLNAISQADMQRAQNPLLFISGGPEQKNLIESIEANPRLLELIKGADYIIGESAGAMVLGDYFWGRVSGNERSILKGLGIVKNTVIMPHYTERGHQDTLAKVMKQSGVAYGLGIDSMTAIVFNAEEFPEKYEKIGNGSVYLKNTKNE